MPLDPDAIRDARITAKRLILLLPGTQKGVYAMGEPAVGSPPARPHWTRVTILIGAMGIGIAINVMLMSVQNAPVDSGVGNHESVSGMPSAATQRP